MPHIFRYIDFDALLYVTALPAFLFFRYAFAAASLLIGFLSACRRAAMPLLICRYALMPRRYQRHTLLRAATFIFMLLLRAAFCRHALFLRHAVP